MRAHGDSFQEERIIERVVLAGVRKEHEALLRLDTLIEPSRPDQRRVRDDVRA